MRLKIKKKKKKEEGAGEKTARVLMVVAWRQRGLGEADMMKKANLWL